MAPGTLLPIQGESWSRIGQANRLQRNARERLQVRLRGIPIEVNSKENSQQGFWPGTDSLRRRGSPAFPLKLGDLKIE